MRKNVACDTCGERPDGCWKAVEYSCTRCYWDAKKNAVRKHLCPLGFLRTAPFVPQRCVVLNLKRRPDRLALAEAQLTKWHPDWPDPQIIEAVDGWGNPACPPEYRNRMKGAWGCKMSHLRVLKAAIDDGLDNLLVLEDDLLLDDDFAEKADRFFGSVPQDWEICFLGGQNIRRPKKIGNGIVRINKLCRTHCYVARRPAILRLYEFWSTLKRGHIDNKLSEQIHAYLAYAPERFIVGQGGCKSDIGLSPGSGKVGRRPPVLPREPRDDHEFREQRIALVRGKAR